MLLKILLNGKDVVLTTFFVCVWQQCGTTSEEHVMLIMFFVLLGNMVKVLRGHQNWVYSSAFSPDSSILCSVGAGKAVSKQVPFSAFYGVGCQLIFVHLLVTSYAQSTF